METDTILTLYRVPDPSEIKDLNIHIARLDSKVTITVSQEKVPAVVGDLAGIATTILLSDPVQALTTAAEIGALLWGIVKSAKAAGKYLRIGKSLVRPMIAAKASDDISKEYSSKIVNIGNGHVWGPMEAEPKAGSIMNCYDDWDSATSPVAYFMGITFPIPRERVRTLWYLLGAGGKLCGSWETQTLRERVPEFLRPDAKTNE